MLEKKLTKIGDRYDIQQQLSQKAGRSTYLASDCELNRLVIIKILEFNSLFQWDDLKLFEREAQTLQNLNHPAIPQYLDYFEIDNEQIQGFALVQTYIEAPSLATSIQQGRKFSEAELIEIAQKLLAILTYLHQQNPPVIHRDLKPSNILISNRTGNSVGELYLVDFGSVQTVASKEEGTITIVGSYGYIPLEQFGGNTVPASDLYSLGMTLIYLLTGVHPAELPQKNGRVEFKDNNISNSFARWLEKMTNPHLDQRFTFAEAASNALISKEGNSGNFLHLRPANSQIKLERDRHKLTITYPEQQFHGFSCSTLMIILVIWITLYLIFESVSTIIAIVLLFMLLKKHNSRNITNKILHITRNGIIKTGYIDPESNKIQWLKLPKDSVEYYVFQIDLVIYNPGYTFDKYIDDRGKVISGGVVEVQPKLSLYSNQMRYRYEIDYQRQSQAELLWLGQEISNFLGQELQVFYPAPKVPREHSY